MNLSAALDAGTRTLSEAQIETPRLDARLLLEWASGLDTVRLISDPDMILGNGQAERFEEAIARRAGGCPLARIVGEKEFWGLGFTLSSGTLVPRPDTETLVEAVLDRIEGPRENWRGTICDLGTGSGAILVALLSELPAATGTGVDICADAIATARANAERHCVADRSSWLEGDYATVPKGQFDIVVSNPPYVADHELSGLSREVRDHDPRRALDGGSDGFDAYRILAGRLANLLRANGLAALELGVGQAQNVSELMFGAGLTCESIVPDLAGIPRVLVCRRC